MGRDFANGYLFAEILHRYFPGEVSMHSFDKNASSVHKKRDNWSVLLKPLKKAGFDVATREWEAICAAEDGAAVEFVGKMHRRLAGGSAPARPPSNFRQSRIRLSSAAPRASGRESRTSAAGRESRTSAWLSARATPSQRAVLARVRPEQPSEADGAAERSGAASAVLGIWPDAILGIEAPQPGQGQGKDDND